MSVFARPLLTFLCFASFAFVTPSYAGCPTDLLLELIPTEYRDPQPHSEQLLRIRILRSLGHTNKQVDALVAGWKLDLAILKFLQRRDSLAVRVALQARGFKTRDEQLVLLSLLDRGSLLAAMKTPEAFDADSEVASLHDVLSERTQMLYARVEDRLASVGGEVPAAPGFDMVLFQRLSVRTGEDAADLQGQFMRACEGGRYDRNADAGVSFIDYWIFNVPLFADRPIP